MKIVTFRSLGVVSRDSLQIKFTIPVKNLPELKFYDTCSKAPSSTNISHIFDRNNNFSLFCVYLFILKLLRKVNKKF